jgi:hypothetical protein
MHMASKLAFNEDPSLRPSMTRIFTNYWIILWQPRNYETPFNEATFPRRYVYLPRKPGVEIWKDKITGWLGRTSFEQLSVEVQATTQSSSPTWFLFHPPSSRPIVSGSLSQLAFRVAAGELFSFPRNYVRYSSQQIHRSCPPLESSSSLLEHWNVEESPVYFMKYPGNRRN